MIREFIIREFRKGVMDKDKRIAAGAIIIAEDTNKTLLAKRATESYKGYWSIVSGGVEDGEEILEGLKRELSEELGEDIPEIDFSFREKVFNEDNNTEFHIFKGLTNSEFDPKLNWENSEYGWFDCNDLPEPLYPNTEDKIKKACEE